MSLSSADLSILPAPLTAYDANISISLFDVAFVVFEFDTFLPLSYSVCAKLRWETSCIPPPPAVVKGTFNRQNMSSLSEPQNLLKGFTDPH